MSGLPFYLHQAGGPAFQHITHFVTYAMQIFSPMQNGFHLVLVQVVPIPPVPVSI